MDLYRVTCVPLLLDACTKTLDTLRLYSPSHYCEDFLRKECERERAEVADLQLWTVALRISICRGTSRFEHSKPSQNQSQMTIMVSSKLFSPPSHPLYPWTSLSSSRTKADFPWGPWGPWMKTALGFKVVGEMYRVREFRLVLCANVQDCTMERTIRALEECVEAERKNGGLDYLPGEPLIISEMRSTPAPSSGF
jgi:hypothetical protein